MTFKIILQVIDILLVSVIFYQVFNFIKNTRAIQMFRGFIVFFVFTIIAGFLHLTVVEWIFRTLWSISFVIFVIIFQPEIRKFLAEVGKKRIYGMNVDRENKEIILKTVNEFSKLKIGAILVFERSVGLKNYIENGVIINAGISLELLKTIFMQNTPLHDGAVIIQNNIIASAASFLPLAKQELDKSVGSRHRAGLGISEVSDAFVFIVSEETGNISYAVDGNMYWDIKYENVETIFCDFCEVKRVLGINKIWTDFKGMFVLDNIKQNFMDKAISFVVGIIFWYYVIHIVVK